jgi:hypothetical protein
MRLVIRVMGLDLLDVELTTATEPEAEDDPAAALNGGSTGAMPMGFTPSPGDQRWQKSAELE